MNKKELKKAHDEGLISDEKFKDELFKLETTPKIKKKKKVAVTLTEEEFIELIKHTKYDHHKVAFLLGFGAGLRVSEIVGGEREGEDDIPPLTKENVDLVEKEIFIADAKGMKQRRTVLPKGFKQKHLKLLPISKFCGARALQAAFTKNARAAGLLEKKPGLHFHCLRSGFISHCLKQGMPIHFVRDLVGHSNISTTRINSELPTQMLHFQKRKITNEN